MVVMGLSAQTPKEEVIVTEHAIYTPSDSSIQWTVQVTNLGNDRYQFKAVPKLLKTKTFTHLQVDFVEDASLEIDSRFGWEKGTNTYTKNFIAKTKGVKHIAGSIIWNKEYKFEFVLKFRKI